MITRGEAGDEMTIRKQAVVLIHGIGEQRPMSTLRGFVEALTDGDTDGYQSKPDRLSESFELRRLDHCVGPRHKPVLETHFYEYYWAFRMRDTRWTHLIDWMARLVWPPSRGRRADLSRVPPQHPGLVRLFGLSWAVLFLFAAVGIGVVMAVSIAPLRPLMAVISGSVIAIVLARLFCTLLTAVSGKVLASAGDAARYLDSAPGNIAERQAIRADGVQLLRRLHKKEKEYDPAGSGGHYLHHAAPFAVTRWTNFWFASDPISGKVAGVFGRGIMDKELAPDPRWPVFGSHTRYWRSGRLTGPCVADLRRILGLGQQPAGTSPGRQDTPATSASHPLPDPRERATPS